MEQTLDERISELGAELRSLLQHEKHRNKGDRQKLNEKLVALRAAKLIAQRREAPVTAVVKPDEHGGGVDLSFRCAGTQYLLEHTTIETFPQQRRWTETGKRSRPLPAWDDLPECRQGAIRSALFTKLPKLKEAARQERECTRDPVVSVLVLECEDYWHSKPPMFLQALIAVLPEFRDHLPDEIQLVGTIYHLKVGMDPLEEGAPTADAVYVLDLVSYRAGASKPAFLDMFSWFCEDPAGDPVIGGKWWVGPLWG